MEALDALGINTAPIKKEVRGDHILVIISLVIGGIGLAIGAYNTRKSKVWKCLWKCFKCLVKGVLELCQCGVCGLVNWCRRVTPPSIKKAVPERVDTSEPEGEPEGMPVDEVSVQEAALNPLLKDNEAPIILH